MLAWPPIAGGSKNSETGQEDHMSLNRRRLLTGLLACPLCAAVARAEGPHWEYEGHGGAAKWGELDEGYKACALGAEQSPIDLSNGIKATLDPLNLDWNPQAYKVVNNGHTIQANAASGSTLRIGKDKYNLVQFHFHTPSEHSLGGKPSAMEVHFVHAQPDGRLAVIGVFMKAGRKNPAFAAIMQAAPKSEGEKGLDKPLDPRQLLPASRSLYRYQGSLTTPPCSEVVNWNVYEQPIEVAGEDIEAFKAIFPTNARPVQPVNRRFLLRGV
jgi:carbonic anhydrase